MSSTRWKQQEREIAAALGGIRLSNNGKGQPDVIARNLAVQVKTRKTLPSWLIAAMERAGRDADPGQTPIVVLSAVSRGKKARRLVVLDLAPSPACQAVAHRNIPVWPEDDSARFCSHFL